VGGYSGGGARRPLQPTLETTSLTPAEALSLQGWMLLFGGEEEVVATMADAMMAMSLRWRLPVQALDGTMRVGRGRRRTM
jgi:hypothetical protein